jgi:hypothetical protein
MANNRRLVKFRMDCNFNKVHTIPIEMESPIVKPALIMHVRAYLLCQGLAVNADVTLGGSVLRQAQSDWC